MLEKVLVEKDFLMKVLKQVDSLSRRVETLEGKTVEPFTFKKFISMNNRLVEAQMKVLNLPYTPVPIPDHE